MFKSCFCCGDFAAAAAAELTREKCAEMID